MQIKKCASVCNTLLFVRPSLPPSLPPFLPTVLYLVLQRQSQYLVQTSLSPVTFVQGTAERTAAGQKQNIWHSGAVQTRGRRACLEARCRFLRGSLRRGAHLRLYIFNQLWWHQFGSRFIQSFPAHKPWFHASFIFMASWLLERTSLTPICPPYGPLRVMTWGFTPEPRG